MDPIIFKIYFVNNACHTLAEYYFRQNHCVDKHSTGACTNLNLIQCNRNNIQINYITKYGAQIWNDTFRKFEQ